MLLIVILIDSNILIFLFLYNDIYKYLSNDLDVFKYYYQ